MLDLFARALLFWLALFELIAGWRRWWGLSWLGSGVATWAVAATAGRA